MGKNEIVLFESSDGVVSLPVSVEADTVWLNILQMAALFSKDRSVILRHIHNAINEGEVDPKVTCAKFAQVTPHGAVEGKTRTQIIDYYNLDVIYLYCAANGLATVCRGTMDRDALKKALNLGDNIILHLNHPIGCK